MWTSKGLDEIEGYISVVYPQGSQRIIGVVCGAVKSPEFIDKIFHLLPKYNLASENIIDFFWIGSADSRRNFDDSINIEDLNYKEEVRVRESIRLSGKIGGSKFDLLKGIKVVILPVFDRTISYNEAVSVDLTELNNMGMKMDDVFLSLIDYSESLKPFSSSEVDSMFNDRFDKDALRRGITSKIEQTAVQRGLEISVGVAITLITKALGL
jgi:hypothetical protein